MLYASCKASFVSALSNFEIKSENLLSLEVDGPSEVSEESLYLSIHPETVQPKKVSHSFFLLSSTIWWEIIFDVKSESNRFHFFI